MKRVLTLLLFAITLIVPGCSSEDENPYFSTGRIEGGVTDKTSGNPISDATITLNPGGHQTLSVSNGNFSLNRVPIGKYDAVCNAAGYQAQKLEVVVEKGAIARLYFQLMKDSSQTPDDGDDDGKENPLDQLECASNEILYTTKYNLPITLGNEEGFGGNLVYNTYEDGVGRLAFGNDVVAIPENAFKDCNSIQYIKLPGGVTEIEYRAFMNCIGLTSISIPESVTTIRDEAFQGCQSLEAFYGKFASSDNRCLVVDGVLNSFAPAGLTEYTIPSGVTSIGSYAFNGCKGLTSISIPDSVTSIGSSAFSGCEGLTSISIPDSVTSIGDTAFGNCTGLTSVYCMPTTPPTGGGTMFYKNASGRKIYVPAESVDAYKEAAYWSDYADAIVGYDF